MRPTVITEAEVRLIHEDRRPYYQIAITYGISSQTVSNIKSRKTWKHLKLPRTTRGRTRQSFPELKKDEQHGDS